MMIAQFGGRQREAWSEIRDTRYKIPNPPEPEPVPFTDTESSGKGPVNSELGIRDSEFEMGM